MCVLKLRFSGRQVSEAVCVMHLLGCEKCSWSSSVAEDAKRTTVSVNSENGKIKEEIHSISSLINKSLKLEVTFCLT